MRRIVKRSFHIPASHSLSGCGIDCDPDDDSIRHNDIAADLYAGRDAVDRIRDRFASDPRLPFERDDAGL